MKIRLGYVSNSSASSFIVAFSHKPKNIEEVREMLFGQQEWHYNSCAYNDKNKDVSTRVIAEHVFNKINKKATKQEMLDSIQHGWFDYYMFPEMFPGHYSNSDKTMKLSYQNKDDRKEMERLWAEADVINENRARSISEAFRMGHKDDYIVVMTFADEDGEAIEEHSGIFKRVDHIRTSYH